MGESLSQKYFSDNGRHVYVAIKGEINVKLSFCLQIALFKLDLFFYSFSIRLSSAMPNIPMS